MKKITWIVDTTPGEERFFRYFIDSYDKPFSAIITPHAIAAYKFEDEKKAEAVAMLTNGKVFEFDEEMNEILKEKEIDEMRRDNSDPSREMFYTDEILKDIEKALGFKLYEWQINYLRGKGGMQEGRASGKTVIYWTDVFLFDRAPLDFYRIPLYKLDKYRYAKSIYDKLKAVGLDVREVNFPKRLV